MPFYLALILSFLLSFSCFAESFQPLLGSLWAEKFPNQLPYSKCAITYLDAKLGEQPLNASSRTWMPPKVETYGFAIGVGQEGFNHYTEAGSLRRPSLALSCISTKYRLAYSIPIKISSMLQLGEIAPFDYINHLRLVFDKTELNGKTFDQVLGDYHGSSAKLNLLGIGGQLSRYQNHFGVKLHNNSTQGNSALIDLAMGYSTMKLKPIKSAEKLNFMNPFLLTHGTQALEVSENSMFTTKDGLPAGITSQGPTSQLKMAITVLEDGSKFRSFDGNQGLFSQQNLVLFHHTRGRRVALRDTSLANIVDYNVLGSLTFVRDE